MEVYEKINLILKKNKMTKRAFSDILISLKPILKSRNTVPNAKAIYKYLSGDINIPMEIISYIAKALDITEQELFETDMEKKLQLYKYIMKNIKQKELQLFEDSFINSETIKVKSLNLFYKKICKNYFHC